MYGLFVALTVLLNTTNAEREPWIEPLAGVRIEPRLPVRHVEDFGPDSAYRILVKAGGFDKVVEGQRDVWDLDRLFTAHRFPRHAPPAGASSGGWSAVDYAKVQALLKGGKPYMELAQQALAAADSQMPTPDTIAADQQYLVGTRQLARLHVFSAYVKESCGDLAGAMDDLLTCIRLGNLGSRGGGILNALIDTAATAIAASAFHDITVRNDVPSQDLRRVANALLQIAENAEPYGEFARVEALSTRNLPRIVLKGGVVEIARLAHRSVPKLQLGASWSAQWFRVAVSLVYSQPATVERDLTYLSQHLVSLADKPYRQEVKDATDAMSANLEARLPNCFVTSKDPLGLLLASIGVPPLSKAHEKVTWRDALLRGTALHLAIMAYEKDKGAPPAALTDLVPDYLPRLPLDPFSGTSFHYLTGRDVPPAWGRATWGVYSIGANFQDDGGKAGQCARVVSDQPHHPENPDLVWLPRPLPTSQLDR